MNGVTIEVDAERGTKEFDNKVFDAMSNMMQSITKDLYKNPIVSFYKSISNSGSSWRVIRKEVMNKQGMFTRKILCYKKDSVEAEFAKQRYEIAHKKMLKIENIKEGEIA